MAGGTWDKLEQVFEDRVARALSKLGVYTQNDVERLAERVDALSEAVNSLIKAGGAAGGGRAQGGRAPQGREAEGGPQADGEATAAAAPEAAGRPPRRPCRARPAAAQGEGLTGPAGRASPRPRQRQRPAERRAVLRAGGRAGAHSRLSFSTCLM